MNEFGFQALAALAGGLLGTIFFGGLWLTVNRSLTHPNPALLFFASLMLRMSVTLAGFYLIGSDHWRNWLACLLGFMVARLIVRRLTRAPPGGPGAHTPETNHAPQSR